MGLTVKTYFDKDNTIYLNSKINMGRNPITTLYYGDGYTRYLLHFDLTRIKKLYQDKTFSNLNLLKHKIKLFNCGSIYSELIGGKYAGMCRAVSFDLVLLPLKKHFDGGIGYDYEQDNFYKKDKLYSEEASNWFKATNNDFWDVNGSINQDEVILDTYHFDKGNESPIFNVTDYINDILTNETENYGLCIKFSDNLEETNREIKQYVGFFSKNTNTFFEPYLETTYDDFIEDDRNQFYRNKTNKLYLYVNIGGNPENLDELPICNIKNQNNEIIDTPTVTQVTKGVYSISTNVSNDIAQNTMIFDVWSNIKYLTRNLDDIEMYTVVRSESDYYKIGDTDLNSTNYHINITNIKNNESIKRGVIRKINVNAKIRNTNNQSTLLNNLEYRIYVKEGLGEIDVIPYTKIEKSNSYNFFYLDTLSLLPNIYYVDIKIKDLNLINYQRNVLSFIVVNDETIRYI